MSPQQTHLQSQNVESLPSAGQPQCLVQETVSNPGPRLEHELRKGMSDTCEDAILQDDLMQNVWHDASRFPEDEPRNSRGTRVLQAPESSSDNAAEEYTSLEVDELQALKAAMERVKSAKVNFNNVGKPAYCRYGYPFKTTTEFYKALFENGFLKFWTPMDEPPLVEISEREAADLMSLEKIDGFMDTKEMMKEMEEIEESNCEDG